jgi:hypothetical protein
MRRAIPVLGLLLLASGTPNARADEPTLQGEWGTRWWRRSPTHKPRR